MATKKDEFMSLVKYLKKEGTNTEGVTAVALDRAISAAIGEGTLSDMFPSTAKAEKYTIKEGKISVGMPAEGYQSYRNDYLILDEDQFDKWYTATYLPSLTASKSATAPKELTLAEIAAMDKEQREEYMRRIQEVKQKSKSATSASGKKEREVKALIAAGNYDSANRLLTSWNARGAESAAMKSGLREEIAKARRNAEEEE